MARCLEEAAEVLRAMRGVSADLKHALSSDCTEVSVLFVGDRSMRRLNHEHRGKDATTDVLSFPQMEATDGSTDGDELGSSEMAHALGDIVISAPQAGRQALELGIHLQDEMRRLLVHGFLHLLGYDHEAGPSRARRMRRIEARILGEQA